MATDAQTLAVSPADHDGGIPAHVSADATLGIFVAGKPRLALGRNGVHEVGAAKRRHADRLLAGALQQLQQQEAGPAATFGVDYRIQTLDPLAGFRGIDVGQLARQPIGDDGVTIGLTV